MEVMHCQEGRETDAGTHCIVILGHARGEVVGGAKKNSVESRTLRGVKEQCPYKPGETCRTG